MRYHWWILLLALGPLTSAGAAERGNLGILTEVHGYHNGKTVLVPFRGLAEWAGAGIAYFKPSILMQRGDLFVRLEIGQKTAWVKDGPQTLSVAPTVYGGITCVPLRFVAEALGLTAEYHAPGSPGSDNDPELVRTGFVPVVVLRNGADTARIIVHSEPPNVVNAVLDDLRQTGGDGWGDYGTAWIIAVGKIRGNTAKAFGPTFYYADDGGSFSPTECSDNDLLRQNGRWRTQGH